MHCGLFSADGGYSRIGSCGLRLVAAASHHVFTTNAKPKLLWRLTDGAASYTLLPNGCGSTTSIVWGVFFFLVAFVAHCKTAVGGGGWITGLTPCCDLAVSVESCLMFHPQASLFHFTMGTNMPPTITSQILNWKPVIHPKL